MPDDFIDAATTGNLVLVLAIAVIALAGVVGFLFKLIVDELRRGRQRAESLTDKALAAFDKLADTTEAALDELRRK